MKKLIMLLVIAGMLISAGGCASPGQMRDMLNKPASEMTVLEWMILK